MYFWQSCEARLQQYASDPEQHTHLKNNLDRIRNSGGMRFLIQRIRRDLVHVTGPEGFRGIQQHGAIFANDGSRPFTYPQSRGCYATVKRAVALFDFENAGDEDLVSTFDRYPQFFTRWHPASFVLHVDRAGLDLIHYDQATAEAGRRPTKIPFVEAWVPEEIPASQISKVTVVREDPFRFWTTLRNDPRLSLAPEQIVAAVWPDLPPPRTQEEIDAADPSSFAAAVRAAWKRARPDVE